MQWYKSGWGCIEYSIHEKSKAISMQEQEKQKPAALELIERQAMRLSGVQNVDVFDEEKIVLQTELGKLEIRGQHLNVTSLDVENGNLQVDGLIDSFVYLEEKAKRNGRGGSKKGGILSRMFS